MSGKSKIGVSMSEAARHCGVSRQALHNAVRLGRVHPLEDGSFDKEKAKQELTGTRRLRRDYINPPEERRARAEAAGRERQAPSSPEQGTLPLEASDLQELVRWNEAEKLRANRMKNAKERGDLVAIKPVNLYIRGVIAQFVGQISKIESELPDQLASEADPLKIREILGKRLRQALKELSEYRPEGIADFDLDVTTAA